MSDQKSESPVVEAWELILRDENDIAIYPDALSNEELKMFIAMREAINRAQNEMVFH